MESIQAETKDIYFKVLPSGCMICTSHTLDKDGYPKVQVKGKTLHMGRYLYEKSFGKLTGKVIVRHTCDTPQCINIAHMLPGTHKDNADDKVNRGRSLAGIRNPNSKLTTNDAMEITKSPLSANILAKKYKVSNVLIYKIKSGQAWKHIQRV